jgi:hypothetical protein
VSLAGLVIDALRQDPDALEELRGLITAPADAPRYGNTNEAADALPLPPKTCALFARQGRIVGAEKHHGQWRYLMADLAVLPPEPRDLGVARAARARADRPEASSTVDAIRGRAA